MSEQQKDDDLLGDVYDGDILSYSDFLEKLHPHIPRVPDSILDGSMTLKEFSEWAVTVKDVQARDDLVIRKWLEPYIRLFVYRSRK